MKNTPTIIISGIVLSSALAAIYVYGQQSNSTTSTTSSASDSDSSSQQLQQKIVTQAAATQLSILSNRCRGCGKCVRIDPSHFSLNQATRQAVVTSNTNLDSNTLLMAINSCPAAAISLN